MSKYRIVKRAMWRLVGTHSWKGYTVAYVIQKKGWFSWKDIGYSIDLDTAQNDKAWLESGKLTDSGDEVVK